MALAAKTTTTTTPSRRPSALLLRRARCRPRSVLAFGEKKRTSSTAAAAATDGAAAAEAEPSSSSKPSSSKTLPIFIDRDGRAIPVMPWDYGFRSGAARTGGVVAAGAQRLLRSPSPVAVTGEGLPSVDGGGEGGNDDAESSNSTIQGKVPANLAAVARANFRAELFALRASVRQQQGGGDENENADNATTTANPLASADRALERAGLLPPLDLGPGTSVGAGTTSAATLSGGGLSSSTSSDDGCSVDRLLSADGSTTDCDNDADNPPWRRVLAALDELTLDDNAVADRDRRRAQALKSGGSSKTSLSPPPPWPVRLPFALLCWLLDALYAGRPLQRFWVLETVARVPYFAYISVLHLYESVGLWRAGAELRRVHFAEEYNELHHLQIMESLGGDRLWFDRFVAEHSAVLYYWLLVALYAAAPRAAYRFSELVELHAHDTYEVFAHENEARLKSLPPPLVAAAYYRGGDAAALAMFDAFQEAGGACTREERQRAERVLRAGGGEGGGEEQESSPRRPPCNNLYDVFINIRDDEAAHVYTMKTCADDRVPEL